MQQYPWAQKPESHSVGIVQAVPIGFNVQLPALQMLGATQSASAVQVARHAVPAASHLYFPHEPGAAAAQAPAPSHSRAGVKVEPLHVAAPHTVLLAYLRHAPAPLQVPSFPQVDAAAIGHCDATSGGSPFAIGEHVPTLPVNEQDMHGPVQAMLQQMLFTQFPDWQSVPTPDGHEPPIGILPQLMATQVLPDVQSDVAVHVVLHAPVPQVYGAHELVVAGRHVPIPSHDRADDSVIPVQLAPAQGVLAAYRRHAPAPLHFPSVPHDVDPMSVHWVAVSGGIPAAIGLHCPTVPVRLQLWHAAAHPVLQQTPCSQ